MLVTALSLTLVGCGGVKHSDSESNIMVEWNNGTMNFGGDDLTNMLSYDGTTATFTDLNGTWNAQIEICEDLTMSSWNTQQVEFINMDEKFGMRTYTEYLETQFTANYEAGDNLWYLGRVTSNALNVDMAARTAKDTFDNLRFTYGLVSCEMNDLIVVSDEYASVSISNEAVILPGMLKVSLGGHEACTSPYTVVQDKDSYTLMKGTVGPYDLYTYEGLFIQIMTGYPIEDYITFK